MNKRGAGVLFCLIAAILFSARYISAAIFMSGVVSWSKDLFLSSLEYIGYPLLSLSTLSLIVGVAYLIWAEWEEWKMR